MTKTIKDFLNFFIVNNKRKSHEFYFFNVPAPIFLVQHGKYLNDQLSKLIKLYNKVFNTNKKPSSCGSCVKQTVAHLAKVYVNSCKIKENESDV